VESPFDPGTFNDAVKNFQAVFTKNPELYRFGQFYLTEQVTQSLVAAIAADFQTDVCLLLANRGKSLVEGISKQLNDPSSSTDDLAAIGKLLADPAQTGGCDLSQYWNLYFQPGSPTASDQSAAQSLFDSVWKRPAIDGNPFIGTPTYRLLVAVHKLEQLGCYAVATGLANKFLSAKNARPIPASVRISKGLTGNACVVTSGLATTARNLQIENVLYPNGSDLTATVSMMQKVTDAGGVLRCGVVSGVRDDNSPRPLKPCGVKYPQGYTPEPEHYILVFAHGVVSDLSAFLFWDPDAGRSRYAFANLNWGPGFGCLFSNAGRLSTAVNNSDLTSINTLRPPFEGSRFQGDHLNPPPVEGNRRHRYQVYSVASLPA
jgi:hypothetical protein